MKSKEILSIAKTADEAIKDKRFDDADKIADVLVKANRSAGLAYKGVVALNKGDLDSAENFLIESFQINPNQNLAVANLIPVYLRKKDIKKALAYGEQAYRLMPDNSSVCVNYAAAILTDGEDAAKALSVLKPHLDVENPGFQVIAGMISCYRSLFMINEAEELLKIAVDKHGDRPEIIRLRADTLAERNPEEAIKSFNEVLKLTPDNIPTKWNMSLVQLRLQDFKEGWKNYDNGLLPEVGKIGRPLPNLFLGAQRILDTKLLDPSKWTVIVHEQGIGDQVLFLGVLNEFLRDFPKTILVAESRFHPLLTRSFPKAVIYRYGSGQILARNASLINGYIPLGSTQKHYRTSREDFLKNRSRYLIPDAHRVEKYRKILLQNTNAKKIYGFSWKGGYWERAQISKTISIDLWDKVFETENAVFVSLQYGDTNNEKERLSRKFKNIRWIEGLDFKKDLDGWLALACACDEIISVSTALVHFAGAAGRSIHLLLSDKGSPFIWGLYDKESIAYENIKIYRKLSSESNESFFKKVARKIV
jgi:hypothetical protein